MLLTNYDTVFIEQKEIIIKFFLLYSNTINIGPIKYIL